MPRGVYSAVTSSQILSPMPRSGPSLRAVSTTFLSLLLSWTTADLSNREDSNHYFTNPSPPSKQAPSLSSPDYHHEGNDHYFTSTSPPPSKPPPKPKQPSSADLSLHPDGAHNYFSSKPSSSLSLPFPDLPDPFPPPPNPGPLFPPIINPDPFGGMQGVSAVV